MKHILFVDDDPLVLKGLQRTLSQRSTEWDMQFAGSGAEAMDLMGKTPADVVVSDMRMPGMNGAELLNEIMRSHPRTARIILSGFADSAMTLQCSGATHQFLMKPCDRRTLNSSIQRALEAGQWMDNERASSLAARLTKLPAMPPAYFQILKELLSADAALATVGKIISREPLLAQHFLALVNSGAFAFGRRVSDPTEAVMQLGIEIVKSLVLAAHFFSEFSAGEGSKVLIDKIGRHCLDTAVRARRIAQFEGKEDRFAQESFMAGLFHDIGRMAIVANLPHDYAEILTGSQMESIPLVQSERTALGTDHAEVGAYLLGLWGLPVGIVEAARFHHVPGECPNREFSPLTACHIANTLDNTPVAGLPRALMGQLDQEYLAAIGVWPRIPVIRKALEKN